LSDRAALTVTIRNRLGLHARPAMAFVDVASQCKAAVTIRKLPDGEPVDGKSIMQLLMLAATQGTQLEITASGDDAADALQRLKELVNSKFGEE
jgi:phosphocarrier protein HPr